MLVVFRPSPCLRVPLGSDCVLSELLGVLLGAGDDGVQHVDCLHAIVIFCLAVLICNVTIIESSDLVYLKSDFCISWAFEPSSSIQTFRVASAQISSSG